MIIFINSYYVGGMPTVQELQKINTTKIELLQKEGKLKENENFSKIIRKHPESAIKIVKNEKWNIFKNNPFIIV